MLRKPPNLHIKLPVFALCAVVLALWVWQQFPCPIRYVTGVICPGCGMGRAWLAALRLDILQALRCHPLFWTVPVTAVFILYDCRVFRSKKANILTLGAIAAGLGVCYLFRLAAFCRGTLQL